MKLAKPKLSLAAALLGTALPVQAWAQDLCAHMGGDVICPSGVPEGSNSLYFQDDGIVWETPSGGTVFAAGTDPAPYPAGGGADPVDSGGGDGVARGAEFESIMDQLGVTFEPPGGEVQGPGVEYGEDDGWEFRPFGTPIEDAEFDIDRFGLFLETGRDDTVTPPDAGRAEMSEAEKEQIDAMFDRLFDTLMEEERARQGASEQALTSEVEEIRKEGGFRTSTFPSFFSTFDGPGADQAAAILPLSTGGAVSIGTTTSFFDGSQNGLVVHADENGTPTRTTVIGSEDPHPDKPVELEAVTETIGGGIVTAGHTPLEVSPNFGPDGTADLLVVNLGPDGTPLWQKRYGGTGHEEMVDLYEMEDGGFLIGATTNSFGAEGDDVFLLRLDADGNVMRNLRLGGPGDDRLAALRRTVDGGMVLAATTTSFADSGRDMLVIRLDKGFAPLWQRRYGGPEDETAADLHLTADGGFLLAGERVDGVDPGQGLLLRLDADGVVRWQKALDHAGTAESLITAQERSDGTIVAAGHTEPAEGPRAGVADVLLLTLSPDGEPLTEQRVGSPAMDDRVTDLRRAENGFLIAGYAAEPSHNQAVSGFWQGGGAGDGYSFISATNTSGSSSTVSVSFYGADGTLVADTSSVVAAGATWKLHADSGSDVAPAGAGNISMSTGGAEDDPMPWGAVFFPSNMAGFTLQWTMQ